MECPFGVASQGRTKSGQCWSLVRLRTSPFSPRLVIACLDSTTLACLLLAEECVADLHNAKARPCTHGLVAQTLVTCVEHIQRKLWQTRASQHEHELAKQE